tara:strand:+ start:143 stop:430 length:288 start_codon:yes stop_codon:yes gene_type:complete
MMHTVLTKQQHDELCDLGGTYSDLYKDLYGMRPRGVYPSTVEEYKKEIAKVSEQLRMEIEQERKEKERKQNRKPFISRPINKPFKVFYERNRQWK